MNAMIGTTAAHSALTRATVRALRRHYLFAEFSDSQWLRLERHIQLHRLESGGRLFSQDEEASAFFIVCAGGVKLFRGSSQGTEKVLRLVRAGQSFAENVLFCDPPHYPVHAQAVTTSAVAAIDRQIYLPLLRESFDTCRTVVAQIVDQTYALWDEVEMLSLHNSQARVSRFLLSLKANYDDEDARSLRLSSPKAAIAAQLGLAPETLSRALHTLSDSGLIGVRGPSIDIHDPQGLRRLAQL